MRLLDPKTYDLTSKSSSSVEYIREVIVWGPFILLGTSWLCIFWSYQRHLNKLVWFDPGGGSAPPSSQSTYYLLTKIFLCKQWKYCLKVESWQLAPCTDRIPGMTLRRHQLNARTMFYLVWNISPHTAWIKARIKRIKRKVTT